MQDLKFMHRLPTPQWAGVHVPAMNWLTSNKGVTALALVTGKDLVVFWQGIVKTGIDGVDRLIFTPSEAGQPKRQMFLWSCLCLARASVLIAEGASDITKEPWANRAYQYKEEFASFDLRKTLGLTKKAEAGVQGGNQYAQRAPYPGRGRGRRQPRGRHPGRAADAMFGRGRGGRGRGGGYAPPPPPHFQPPRGRATGGRGRGRAAGPDTQC